MKTKVAVLAVVALIAWGLKRHYADAPTDALSWILTPTATMVSLVTGVVFTHVPGEGYFSAERLFLIEKACAGVNFMIAAFAMVAFTLLHRVRSVRDGAAVIGMSLLASYAAAVIVNSVRITIALWLAAHPVRSSALTAAEIHRLEGIVVYFGGLLLLYTFVQRIDRGAKVFAYALPLGCYYVVTLVLPFVNGASRNNETFLSHAMIVLLVPAMLVVLIWGTTQLFARYAPRNVSAGSSAHARRAGSHAAAPATRTIAAAPNT